MLIILLAGIVLLVFPSEVYAHTPHDEIELVRLSINFMHDRTLFAIARANLYVSFDAGQNWLRKFSDLPHSKVRDVLLSHQFHQDGKVIVATETGIFFSVDQGAHWSRSIFDSQSSELSDPARKYTTKPKLVSGQRFENNSDCILLLLENRILISRNFGMSWHDTNIKVSEITCMTASQEHFFVANRMGLIEVYGWSNHTLVKQYDFRLNEGSFPTVMEFDESVGLLVGTDGNGIVQVVFSFDRISIRNIGPDNKRITGICTLLAVESEHQSLIAASEWNDGVYLSRDHGITWELSNKHLTRDSQADEFQFSTAHFKHITGVQADVHSFILYLSGFDGLFFSLNNGKSWSEIDNIVRRELIVGLTSTPQGVAASLYGGGVRHFVKQNEYKALEGLRTFAIGAYTCPQNLVMQGIWVATHNIIYVFDASLQLKRQISLTKVPSRKTSLASKIRARITPTAKLVIQNLPPVSRNWLKSFIRKNLTRFNIGIHTPAFGSTIAFPAVSILTEAPLLTTWKGGLFQFSDGDNTFRYLWEPDAGDRILGAILINKVDHAKGVFYVLTEKSIFYASNSDGILNPISDLSLTGDMKAFALLSANTEQTELIVSTSTGLYKLVLKNESRVDHCQTLLTIFDDLFITEIAVSPDYTKSHTILINKSGKGLYNSFDGGNSFHKAECPEEWDCSPPTAFPDASRMISYSVHFAEDKTVYAASDCDIFVSRDCGKNWEKLYSPSR